MVTFENQKRSMYLMKDLSTITGTIRCIKLAIIDGRLFVLPNTANAGTIEVRDYQTNALLKTINTGANVETQSICFDDDYIYVSKCIETITDNRYRNLYIRKYNRCTLDFVSESPVLYTGIVATTSTNWSNIFAMAENGEYLYLACSQTMQIAGDFQKIRKIKKTDFSSVADIAWSSPLNIIKHVSGFFVSGLNTASKSMRVDFLDWDLNVIQTFPQTTLTINRFSNGLYKDDFLYAANWSGVLVKYQISTNTIAAETLVPDTTTILNIILINNDFLLLQTNLSKLMLYDLNLNFIKRWDYFNASTGGGYIVADNNNTIWTQSASQPNTIYKKQFIDLSSGVM